MVAKATYASPGDELAVVELDPLEVVAVDQVVEALVRNERAVVQFCSRPRSPLPPISQASLV